MIGNTNPRAKPKNVKLAYPVTVMIRYKRKYRGQTYKFITCTTRIQFKNALEQAKKNRPDYRVGCIRYVPTLNDYRVHLAYGGYKFKSNFGYYYGTPEEKD